MCYAHRCTVNFCPRGVTCSLDDSIRVVPLLLTLCSAKEKRAASRTLTTSPRNVTRQIVVARERHVAIVITSLRTQRKVSRHMGLQLISASRIADMWRRSVRDERKYQTSILTKKLHLFKSLANYMRFICPLYIIILKHLKKNKLKHIIIFQITF